jgi:transglutaminase-like putative cysteine protease
MIYDIVHITRYHYRSVVPLTRCLLRLLPTDRRRQRVISARLSIEPAPSERKEGLDFFGNRVVRAVVRASHESLSLVATSRIEVDGGPPADPAATPPWEEIATAVPGTRDLSPESPIQALFPSRNVPLLGAATGYAEALFRPGRPILAAAFDLTCRIKADFTYDPTATDVATPIARVLADRRGVCQDFAHVMIAGLRGLGLPARYVSGYLRTTPPPGKRRLEGADATHAWVEVWCGRETGWVGLDPTNGIMADDSHVILAVGRDYADVSPVDGVVVTSGDHGLVVSVDVAEVKRPGARPEGSAPTLRPS